MYSASVKIRAADACACGVRPPNFATTGHWLQGVGTTRLTAVAASADTPMAARSPSVVSLTPSGTERRHRSVAASPTRFFELLVSFVAKLIVWCSPGIFKLLPYTLAPACMTSTVLAEFVPMSLLDNAL